MSPHKRVPLHRTVVRKTPAAATASLPDIFYLNIIRKRLEPREAFLWLKNMSLVPPSDVLAKEAMIQIGVGLVETEHQLFGITFGKVQWMLGGFYHSECFLRQLAHNTVLRAKSDKADLKHLCYLYENWISVDSTEGQALSESNDCHHGYHQDTHN